MGALLLAGPASAERPGFYARPGLLGEPKVGAELVGYVEGIRCNPACAPSGPEPQRAGIFYQWLACKLPGGGGREAPPGGLPDEGGPCPYPTIIRPASQGAGADRFVVPDELVGYWIQFEVIARAYDCGVPNYQTGGQECRYVEAHGWSATVGPIEPPPPPPPVPPANPVPPRITGIAEDRQRLSLTSGTWTGDEPRALTYQWLRCSRALNGCRPIAGATGATYAVAFADIGARLTATVTATNVAGSGTANANLTAKVVGAKPRPGADALEVEELETAHRLVLEGVTFSPGKLRARGLLRLRMRVVDRRGFKIVGALVRAAGPPGQISSARGVTDESGTAVLRLRAGASLRGSVVPLTVTASKSADDDRPGSARVVVPVLTR